MNSRRSRGHRRCEVAELDVFKRQQLDLDGALARLRLSPTTGTIHESRVAARTFHAVSHALHRKPLRLPTKRLSEALRELLQDLGPVRDADVRLQTLKLVVRSAGGAAPEMRDLTRAARTLRDRLRREFDNRTKSAGWSRRLEAIGRRSALLQARTQAGDVSLDRVGDMIHRRDRGLRRRLRRQPRSPAKIHALRLRVKELRYLLAAFAPLCGALNCIELKRLEKLQRQTGAFHDLFVLRSWIESAAPGHAVLPFVRESLRSAKDRLLAGIGATRLKS